MCHRLNATRARPHPYSEHFPSRNPSVTLAAVTVVEESTDAQRWSASAAVATSSKNNPSTIFAAVTVAKEKP